MRVYADSSFPVSCYLVDANTPQAKASLDGRDTPLPFTALHELEVRNARSLDILHVAAAKALRLKEFASFDSRQRAPGAAAGLTNSF